MHPANGFPSPKQHARRATDECNTIIQMHHKEIKQVEKLIIPLKQKRQERVSFVTSTALLTKHTASLLLRHMRSSSNINGIHVISILENKYQRSIINTQKEDIDQVSIIEKLSKVTEDEEMKKLSTKIDELNANMVQHKKIILQNIQLRENTFNESDEKNEDDGWIKAKAIKSSDKKARKKEYKPKQ